MAYGTMTVVKNWPDTVVPEVVDVRPLPRGGSSLPLVLMVAGGAISLSLVTGSHTLLALIAIPLVISMAWSNPAGMIGILPIWLVLLGMVRRLTTGGTNVTFSGDPLLLIAPLALLVMWLMVTRSREPGALTPLARWVLAFNVVALLQAFNPTQGSLLTGLGGVLFLTIPTLAFWIGRRLAEPIMIMRVIWTVALVSLIAAAYGLYQQFVGFPSWDQSWIASKGYAALNVGGGVTRAFSSFSSAQEYAAFLSVGAVAWAALLTKSTRWPILLHLAALATVLTALFYESQRTSVFLVTLALGMMAAAKRRYRPINVALAGTVAVALLILFAGAIGGSSSTSSSSSPGSVLAQHQLSGVSQPLGSNSSLSGHISATRKGLLLGIRHPLGRGTGATTLAAGKYSSSSHLTGTEFDPGNMAIDFGAVGIVVYLMLLLNGLRTAYRLAVRRRDTIGLFVIGIAGATLFQWTNGDLYSVCWLVWLAFGFADHLLKVETDRDEAARVVVDTFTWRRPSESARQAPAQ